MLKPLLFVLLVACAAPLQAQQRPDAAQADALAVAAERVARNYHLRIAVEIAASGEPRDLALAAVLHGMATAGEDAGGDDPAAGWRARAAAAAGDDVLANALLAFAGEAEAARRWARAEPDNIAPLLFQDGGVDVLLAGAPGFTRFDQHMYGLVRWIQSQLAAHPPTASERQLLFAGADVPVEEFAAISAMGLWAAVAMPSLDELVEACEGRALRGAPARRAGCNHLARTLVGHSDTTLGRMLGIDMLARMAGDASERAEAQALGRRMDWQMLEWGRIAAAQPRDGAPQFTRLLADPAVRTEQDLVERVLAEAGVSPYPPTGWQPPRR